MNPESGTVYTTPESGGSGYASAVTRGEPAGAGKEKRERRESCLHDCQSQVQISIYSGFGYRAVEDGVVLTFDIS